MKNKTKGLFALFVFAAVFITGKFLDKGQMMIPEFTAPYFSGAALYHHGSEWQFNLNEVDSLHALNKISDPAEKTRKINAYRFSKHKLATRTYSINQPGYLHLINLAKFLFPFTGDIGSVKILQVTVHVLISFAVLLLLKKLNLQIPFLLLYVFNPLIIYYALYPFYYFWTIIPSAFFVILYLYNKKIPLRVILFLSIVLAFFYHVRSSILFISLFVLLFSTWHQSWLKKFSVLTVYLLAIWFIQSSHSGKHPGHIMYTSLGAYPNKYVQGFNDRVSWKAYEEFKGIDYNYSTVPGMYDAEVFFGESEWCLRQFKEIAIREPLMILRNSTLNLFQAFSAGHIRENLYFNYLSSIFGFIFFIAIIVRKKFLLLTAILTSVITYVLYLPPLPVYLYGSYLILILAFMEIISSFSGRLRT
jgi:hypothetical protein